MFSVRRAIIDASDIEKDEVRVSCFDELFFGESCDWTRSCVSFGDHGHIERYNLSRSSK